MTLLVILCPGLYLLCLQAVFDLESNFQTCPTVPIRTLPFKINLLKVEVESTSCARAPERARSARRELGRALERLSERVPERVRKWTNPIFFHFLLLQRQRIIFKRILLAPWHCLSCCALAYIYYVFKQSLILKAIFKPTLLYPSEPCHSKSFAESWSWKYFMCTRSSTRSNSPHGARAERVQRVGPRSGAFFWEHVQECVHKWTSLTFCIFLFL